MVIRVEVNDEQLQNVSVEAKETLHQQVERYAENILKEANLIEEGNREDGANREITSSIVLQAVRQYKRLSPKKKDKSLIVIKIISAFPLLLTGFLFDEDGYQNSMIKEN